jgi:hypothetical protein
MRAFGVALASAFLATMAAGAAVAELPDAIAARDERILFQVHAEGAQIYECKAAEGTGRMSWQFREPIAALFHDGKTVGRHYAGPTWEIAGNTVAARVVGRAPGASGKDISLLKLEVAELKGDGPLNGATTVQRINTAGGNMEGACDKVGDLKAEPYSADYVFLKKSAQ